MSGNSGSRKKAGVLKPQATARRSNSSSSSGASSLSGRRESEAIHSNKNGNDNDKKLHDGASLTLITADTFSYEDVSDLCTVTPAPRRAGKRVSTSAGAGAAAAATAKNGGGEAARGNSSKGRINGARQHTTTDKGENGSARRRRLRKRTDFTSTTESNPTDGEQTARSAAAAAVETTREEGKRRTTINGAPVTTPKNAKGKISLQRAAANKDNGSNDSSTSSNNNAATTNINSGNNNKNTSTSTISTASISHNSSNDKIESTNGTENKVEAAQQEGEGGAGADNGDNSSTESEGTAATPATTRKIPSSVSTITAAAIATLITSAGKVGTKSEVESSGCSGDGAKHRGTLERQNGDTMKFMSGEVKSIAGERAAAMVVAERSVERSAPAVAERSIERSAGPSLTGVAESGARTVGSATVAVASGREKRKRDLVSDKEGDTVAPRGSKRGGGAGDTRGGGGAAAGGSRTTTSSAAAAKAQSTEKKLAPYPLRTSFTPSGKATTLKEVYQEAVSAEVQGLIRQRGKDPACTAHVRACVEAAKDLNRTLAEDMTSDLELVPVTHVQNIRQILDQLEEKTAKMQEEERLWALEEQRLLQQAENNERAETSNPRRLGGGPDEDRSSTTAEAERGQYRSPLAPGHLLDNDDDDASSVHSEGIGTAKRTSDLLLSATEDMILKAGAIGRGLREMGAEVAEAQEVKELLVREFRKHALKNYPHVDNPKAGIAAMLS